MSMQSTARSPHALSPVRSLLVVIDVQERLVPTIAQHESVVRNIRFLMDVAELLKVRTVVTEQYPKGLGPTIPELASHKVVASRLEKIRFSAAQVLLESGLANADSAGPIQFVLAGIESHICVQQTALDLLHAGHAVFLAADATGSRHPADSAMAIQRMQKAGVIVTTVESAAFEWCEKAGSDEFKSLSQLVRARYRQITEPSG